MILHDLYEVSKSKRSCTRDRRLPVHWEGRMLSLHSRELLGLGRISLVVN
jgi:hypothetical protein